MFVSEQTVEDVEINERDKDVKKENFIRFNFISVIVVDCGTADDLFVVVDDDAILLGKIWFL